MLLLFLACSTAPVVPPLPTPPPPVQKPAISAEEAALTLGLPATMSKFLKKPDWSTEPREMAGLQIVSLSNFAEACVHPAISDPEKRPAAQFCTEQIANAALMREVTRIDPHRDAMGDYNLYLSHFLIVLESCERVGGDCDKNLATQIANHLVERSMAHPSGNALSYPTDSSRWPADQSATLYALWLYDHLHATHLADAPTARWLQYIQTKATEKQTGLPYSELTNQRKTSKMPRGCTLSWTVRYASSFAPEYATQIWSSYKRYYYVDLLAVTGFREWPLGRDQKADVDSGPIILGVGSAATAFGLGAARAMGDTVTFLRLQGTAAAMDTLVHQEGGELAKTADTLMAQAIRINGETLVPWF